MQKMTHRRRVESAYYFGGTKGVLAGWTGRVGVYLRKKVAQILSESQQTKHNNCTGSAANGSRVGGGKVRALCVERGGRNEPDS
jgi:hypothetical protein